MGQYPNFTTVKSGYCLRYEFIIKYMGADMEKSYRQCQSCGMPLKMDRNGGGSERGGSLNAMYCSSCFRDGAFVRPDMTVGEMQELVDDVLKREMHWWRPLRWLAVRQIPKLVRWAESKR